MSFDLDTSNPHFAKAVDLREIFARDAAERDRAGGKPVEQLAQLKASGLLNLLIPQEFGGFGERWSTAYKIVREFAKVDGALGHLYGYHFGSQHAAHLRGTTEQAADIFRRSAAGNWFWGNTANSFSKSLFGRRDGEGFILDGYRPFTSGSHIADYLQVAWEDHETNARSFAAIPASRDGIHVENDWDGFGQRQTGSGRVSYKGVRVHRGEVLEYQPDGGRPYQTITPFLRQSTLLNVFIGSAQGALITARDYTRDKSRPWIHSDVDQHTDDPWIKRVYGEFYTRVKAATLLADEAAAALDWVWSRGRDLTAQERGEASVVIAGANVHAGEVALDVTSRIFEVMGARSATIANGYDRFWRNVRIHTLHNPAEYKTRNVGSWFLTGAHPAPSAFQ
ncbi:acyl-CoA dehydrogenase family protein [Bradyrhizobium sp. CIAT3101]|uniref:acyl-CoA dehydrogenase family protein n=1 Tax=Bradyrhizobium sp. CIAT3101 TaxID=439387 RepID=UPI0024B16931|nr:acyl-CoA dehydrogenase family protein [Bradyrhizobium sp. CIAT3101]WFU78168.1 acyl-CoA dehydrogenase family protein [Bradyrhizobium sp. CIAT3101]